MKKDDTNSMALVAEINDYLDNLKRPNDKKEHDKHINQLKEYREKMEQLGFKTPFTGILSIPKFNYFDNDPAQSIEVSKQLKLMKYLAKLKKITLNRTKISYISHKIGWNMLEGCPQNYDTLTNHIPYDGNYLRPLANIEIEGFYAFNKIKETLQNTDEKWLIATVEYNENSSHTKAKIRMDKTNMKEIKEMYGEDCKIIKTKIIKKKDIISNDISKMIVSLIFASYGKQQFDNEENKTKSKESSELKEYNTLLQKHGLVKNILIDKVDGFENVKELLIEKGLLEHDEENYLLILKLKNEIMKKRKQINQSVLIYSINEMMRIMYSYYIKYNTNQRSTIHLFPGLSLTPDENILSMFESSNIKDAYRVLDKKIEMENTVPKGYNPLWGVGFYASETKTSIADCSELFDENEEVVKKALEDYKIIKNDRSKEFIRFLKEK